MGQPPATSLATASPWFSVYPQQLIYRRYLIFRYKAIFRNEQTAAWASAAVFGVMHVTFHNAVAPSLALTCAEHTLLGLWVFTFGLGELSYDGAVKPAP